MSRGSVVMTNPQRVIINSAGPLSSGCSHALFVCIPNAQRFMYNPRNQEDCNHVISALTGVKTEVVHIRMQVQVWMGNKTQDLSPRDQCSELCKTK